MGLFSLCARTQKRDLHVAVQQTHRRIELQITGTIKKVTITADGITKSKILLFG
jgi:hypothetical protein